MDGLDLTVAGAGHGAERGVRAIHGRAAAALRLLGLGERLDYKAGRLSGGQKQRVAVARALVGNPEVVFADEPTAALDNESGFEVVALLRRLARQRGTTTLMVTHDNRILDLADRIIVMEDGRVSGLTISSGARSTIRALRLLHRHPSVSQTNPRLELYRSARSRNREAGQSRGAPLSRSGRGP